MTTTKVSRGVTDDSAGAITGEIRMWSTGTPPTGWLDKETGVIRRKKTRAEAEVPAAVAKAPPKWMADRGVM